MNKAPSLKASEGALTGQSSARIGVPAPSFELDCTATPEHPPKVARLKDYRGRWLILMFYPQDFSLVCPTELMAMSKRRREFARRNAEILAVSTDSIESHERWITTDPSRGGLGPIGFPLASDVDGRVARTYNVYASSQHLALRGLFIVDPNFILQYQVVHNLSIGRSTEEVFRVLQALQVGGMCAEGWAPGQPPLEPAVQLKPGSTISHYNIEQILGEGGCGTVFRAYDRVLQRTVALKILKGNGSVRRLREEARAAAALNHPNICTIHGIEEKLGVTMIVLEYLEGQPVSKTIAQGPISTGKVREVGRQIAAGLAAAHSRGIVHGDLKPSNIMLDRNGRAKILDFSLANRQGCSDSEATRTSGCEVNIGGTPGYMSPEQVDGAPATTRSDIFSFGLILYELLTGKQALSGRNALQLLNHTRSIQPEKLAGQLEEPFSRLVPRMLEPNPEKRTVTIKVIEDALRHPETKSTLQA